MSKRDKGIGNLIEGGVATVISLSLLVQIFFMVKGL
jgi:hypothetical protein